ncbi:hypothetical protein LTR74_008057 [Friedmanniomyces endolithicus]|nr:hypothetical protein LTR74_008057 [Friedmanniomyces endolithicus]
MADAPPSYQSAQGFEYREKEAESTSGHRFKIREEIGAYRSQHVTAVVATVVLLIRDRARGGLANSTLLLLPSDQEDSRKGTLVGYSSEEPPVLVQLEGEHDTMEFWRQPKALRILQEQVLAAISDTLPSPADDTPVPPRAMLPRKTSLFGRKPGKAFGIGPPAALLKAPVAVKADLHSVFFRTENEYGLYHTVDGQAVALTVEVS